MKKRVRFIISSAVLVTATTSLHARYTSLSRSKHHSQHFPASTAQFEFIKNHLQTNFFQTLALDTEITELTASLLLCLNAAFKKESQYLVEKESVPLFFQICCDIIKRTNTLTSEIIKANAPTSRFNPSMKRILNAFVGKMSHDIIFSTLEKTTAQTISLLSMASLCQCSLLDHLKALAHATLNETTQLVIIIKAFNDYAIEKYQAERSFIPAP